MRTTDLIRQVFASVKHGEAAQLQVLSTRLTAKKLETCNCRDLAMVSKSMVKMPESSSLKELWDRLSAELPWKLHEASPEDLACFWGSHSHFHANALVHLQKWSSINAHKMAPRQLANIALIAAKSNVTDMFAESNPLRCAILAKMPEFWDLDLGQTCYAFGKLRKCDEPLLTAISERFLALDFRLKLDTLAAAVYCFSRCGYSSPALLNRLWSRITLDAVSDSHLLMLLADSRSTETGQVRYVLTQKMSRQTPAALVQLLCHFSEFRANNPGVSDDDFLRCVLDEVLTRSFSSSQSQEISRLTGLIVSHKLTSDAKLLKKAAAVKRALPTPSCLHFSVCRTQVFNDCFFAACRNNRRR